jgi:hypothetical protein
VSEWEACEGDHRSGAKSQGMKQLMAGAGIILLSQALLPQLAALF